MNEEFMIISMIILLSSYKAHEPLDKAVCLRLQSNPLINLEGDALDAIIGMKPNGLVHVLRLLKLLLKLVVALVKGFLTLRSVYVVNLVITYKIDGGNLIDFYPSFLSTVNAIVIAQIPF
jgi:hypothetical protein